MKKWATLLFACMCAGGVVFADHSADVVQQVRVSIGTVIAALPPRRHGVCEYMREFGYHYKQTHGYDELAAVVSNNFDVAYANFSICATNDLERMVFLSSAWAYDENYCLSCFSNVLEMAVNGGLTKQEFAWFRVSSLDDRFLGVLFMRYDQPGISNLVLRMQTYTGQTNYCQSILNGDLKADFLRRGMSGVE